MADEFPAALQESVLALLAFDESWGSAAAAVVRPEHFDGVYHEIAKRVLAYRRRYSRAPGAANLETLFTTTQLDPDNRKTSLLRQTLLVLEALSESINGAHIAGRAAELVRRQTLKTAIIEASERYGADEDGLVADVERILYGALRQKQEVLDAGTFLSAPGALSFLDGGQEDFVALGIPELDRRGIGPVPGEMLLYVASKNTGKSWFCIHCGRQALMQRKRVMHISLEMSEPQVVGRYFQSLFGVAKDPGPILRTVFEMDELDRLVEVKTTRKKPKRQISLRGEDIRKVLRAKQQKWGTRLGRLVVKRFPTRRLTIDHLVGYLDYMEDAHRFVPNMLIVDYPDLMKVASKDFRISLGHTYEDLRGLAVERNLALVCPTQGNRSAIGARKVQGKMVSEDISKVHTADTVLVYSQTEAEFARGLARLGVEYARDTERGTVLVISQSYATGQYVVQSIPMPSEYWDHVKGDDEEDDEE